MKFTEGAWLIVLPMLVVVTRPVRAAYGRIGKCPGANTVPAPPRPGEPVIVVPISEVSELGREALSAALSLSDDMVTAHVRLPGADPRLFDPPTGWNRILPSHRSEELERQLRCTPGTLVARLHLQT